MKYQESAITKREIPRAKLNLSDTLDKSLMLDVCSEVNCGAQVIVEKDFKSGGRKIRCTNCIMKMKFYNILPLLPPIK